MNAASDADRRKPGAISITRDEVHAAFRAALKRLHCPTCDFEYTDSAVDWAEAWLEGRLDLMREEGKFGRDGPIKLRCELCGARAWTDAFLSAPKRAEPSR
jgi:hypothetical protein